MSSQTATAKKPWQPPTVRQHRSGMLNKFGRIPSRDSAIRESIDGIPITRLVEEYGSPLFATSETRLRQNVRQLLAAFRGRYPKVIHGWSYKTNYTSAICNILHQEGSWAEVVSAFEYEKARHLGVPGSRILFNGPHKSRRILERAISEGAHLHIDHFDELQTIAEIAAQRPTPVTVTLRINMNTGFSEPWSRFGFNLESGEAFQAARRIDQNPNLKLGGLHCHIGTFILEPRAYTEAVKALCGFMNRVEAETDALIEYIDVGGGLPSQNSLQGIYLPPEQAVPELDTFAEAICAPLREAVRDRESQGRPIPTLILESGRAVVDDAQTLVSSVVARKQMPDGRPALVLDAGVNLLFTGFWYDHQIQLTRKVPGLAEDTVLYGPLCMNIDVVRRSAYLPPLAAGEILSISPVGAYNNTQWLQFIEYRPAVVLIHEKGDAEISVIRAAENLEVLNAQDRLPPHLQEPFPRESGE